MFYLYSVALSFSPFLNNSKLFDHGKSATLRCTFSLCSNLALWIALLFISGGAAIGTTVVSTKKKYNR